MSEIEDMASPSELREMVRTLTRERDEARADIGQIAAAAGLEEDDTDRLSIVSAIQAMDSTIRRLEGDRDDYQQAATDAENAAQVLRTANARLRGALKALSTAERHYRDMYQRHGGQAFNTGRAWDMLRKAGIKARAALAGEA